MKKDMLLAVDIGNSNVIFGIFNGARLLERRAILTRAVSSLHTCNSAIYSLPHRSQIGSIVICSVVPEALLQLERILKRIFKKEILVLGRDLQAPIKNLYRQPEQVGQDRLVNAVAASALYNKKGKRPLVIIDFGTAVTFDAVSRKGEYLGGLIFPGIRLSLENLVNRAALLPKIEIKRPRSLIGGDTQESMRSGLLNGYGLLCDGVVKRINSIFKIKSEVIATGGDAALISRYCASIRNIDANLTLRGLMITYRGHKKDSKDPKRKVLP